MREITTKQDGKTTCIPEKSCEKINKWLNTLPKIQKPSDVPFENGLYFFYEEGETSGHAPQGRIVRVGNHPLSQDSLKRRLRMHYSGGKNGSVFRRLLGGAIMRRADRNNPCLKPGPGQGHWEKQGMHICESCKPIEGKVREHLRNSFWFRCIEIEERGLRNTLEKKLIATISLCPVCKPSANWLGKFAYPLNVQNSGLWNSDYVFDQDEILDESEIQRLAEIIERTARHF
jgi:hypothetical protein